MTPNIISIYQILILPAKSKQNKRKKIHLTTKSNNSYLLISLDYATAYSHTLILNYSVTNRFWLFVNPSRQGGVSSPPSYTIQHNENSPIVRHSLYPFMCCNCGESLCASRYLSPSPSPRYLSALMHCSRTRARPFSSKELPLPLVFWEGWRPTARRNSAKLQVFFESCAVALRCGSSGASSNNKLK